MEKKFLGVVLNNIDYKEKDKLVSIFSVVDGLVLGKLKSVKRAEAKLKMLSSPFCFAEFIGVENAGKLTITGGDIIDSFFDITKNIESYFVGCCILNYIYSYLKNDYSKENLKENFKLLVDSLKTLSYAKSKPKAILIKYFLNHLKLSGYALDFFVCSNCKKGITNEESAFIDFIDGGIKCENCTGAKNIEIFSNALNALKQIEEEKDFYKVFESEKNLNNSALNDALRFLGNYIFLQMNYKIKIEELLKI